MIAQQHALTNKITTGSARPQTAQEYAISKKIHINVAGSKSAKGYGTCERCRSNAKSMNPGNPPVHPGCRCRVKTKK